MQIILLDKVVNLGNLGEVVMQVLVGPASFIGLVKLLRRRLQVQSGTDGWCAIGKVVAVHDISLQPLEEQE